MMWDRLGIVMMITGEIHKSNSLTWSVPYFLSIPIHKRVKFNKKSNKKRHKKGDRPRLSSACTRMTMIWRHFFKQKDAAMIRAIREGEDFGPAGRENNAS